LGFNFLRKVLIDKKRKLKIFKRNITWQAIMLMKFFECFSVP
jgi:hypothetical protein